METPSSRKRVTRSQTFIALEKNKQEDPFPRLRTDVNSERSALLNITNDSPIIGLAMGSLSEKTASSSLVKNRVRAKNTPESGEALLRCQVKTLLQKVEEEAELVNKLSSRDHPPFRVLLGLQGSSPAQLLAPTPTNTPQIPSLSGIKEEVSMEIVMPSVAEEVDPKITSLQVGEDLKQKEIHQECLINRALLFDSPGKSEASGASTISLTYQGSEISSYQEKSPEDDNSSAWSIQVNTSFLEDDDEEKIEYFDEEDDDDAYFDDLCEGLRKMSMQDKVRLLPECTGKHTRFIYNSDDEIEGEEEVRENCNKVVSPSVLLLKGLPVPEGKHLRFHDEEEDRE